MASSSHHMIFFSVPPLDQYRLLMAMYKNGTMMRRVPLPICANCPPSKNTCSTGRWVVVKKSMAKSAPMEDATTSASLVTPCVFKNTSTCRTSSCLPW